jgi:nucleotide-binding universal stress UspA family protein
MLAHKFTVIRSITLPIVDRNQSGFRDIIFPLASYRNAYATTAFALSVAREFDSAVTGIAFAFEPAIPVSGPFDAVPAALVEEMFAQSETEARANALAFERQAEEYGIEVANKLIRSGFRESEDYFAEAARSFDLAVVPQCSADDPMLPNFAETALFHSGRPILAVPFIQREELSLSRVLVCWDGSRAAARAVSDAWPLIERATNVNVVTVGRGDSPLALQKDFGEHLSKHGVNARLDILAAEDIDAGNAILSYAADLQSNLIVMGGYGHSRLREWVLGGATRTILQTMTAPVLLSH